jgi:hypothetical protein
VAATAARCTFGASPRCGAYVSQKGKAARLKFRG